MPKKRALAHGYAVVVAVAVAVAALLRLSPFLPPPLLLGTPRLQPWLSQPCLKSASAPKSAVPAAALALASRYPRLQPWVSHPCRKSASAPGSAVRAAALAVASRYPKASALGLTATPEKRGFSPWGMLSCPWPPSARSSNPSDHVLAASPPLSTPRHARPHRLVFVSDKPS